MTSNSDAWNDTPSDTNPPSIYPDGNPKAALGAAKTGYRFALIPVAMEEMSKSLKAGADKYGEMNWRTTGVRASVYVDALMRHFLAWKEGEDFDPETGANHLGHIMGNCAILMDAAAKGCLLDDRVSKL